MTQGPIGIFDSGYGGLTVLKEIQKVLPDYDFIYLGDNARAPYGTRSFEVVYEYTLQAVKYLFKQGCPLVILACNTASAKALRSIQQKDLESLAPTNRVLGVIRPTTEEVDQLSQTKKIGVLGTSGTVDSKSYEIEIKKFFPHIDVFQTACPMWVPLIENNEYNSIGGEFFIEKYTNELMQQEGQIDTVILGCTHYPIIQDQIQEKLPDSVTVISQGEIVAQKLQDYLKRHPEMDERLSRNGSIKFFTTESTSKFDVNASLFFDKEIHSTHVHY